MLTENQNRLVSVRRNVDEINTRLYYNVLPKYINESEYKNGIEIGVLYGGHIEHILNNTKAEMIIGIDPYLNYGVDQSGCRSQQDFDDMYLLTVIRLSGQRSKLIRATSEAAFAIIQAYGSFDFIFIDGHHTYEATKMDIQLYSTLIKPKGMLSGHDYGNFPGVTQAVDEYVKENNKQLIKETGTVWIINF